MLQLLLAVPLAHADPYPWPLEVRADEQIPVSFYVFDGDSCVWGQYSNCSVRDACNEPLGRVKIELFPAGVESLGDAPLLYARATDADGNVEFPELTPGTYRWRAWLPGRYRMEGELTVGPVPPTEPLADGWFLYEGVPRRAFMSGDDIVYLMPCRSCDPGTVALVGLSLAQVDDGMASQGAVYGSQELWLFR